MHCAQYAALTPQFIYASRLNARSDDSLILGFFSPRFSATNNIVGVENVDVATVFDL